MATRSNIGIELFDGTVKYICVHWAGYPDKGKGGVGDKIRGHSYKSILKIVERGDISGLPDGELFDNGEARTVESKDSYILQNPDFVDYKYLMDIDGNLTCYYGNNGTKVSYYKGTSKNPLSLVGYVPQRRSQTDKLENVYTLGAVTNFMKEIGYTQRPDLFKTYPTKFRVGDIFGRLDDSVRDAIKVTGGEGNNNTSLFRIVDTKQVGEVVEIKFEKLNVYSIGTKVVEVKPTGSMFIEKYDVDDSHVILAKFGSFYGGAGTPYYRPSKKIKPNPVKELTELEESISPKKAKVSHIYKSIKEDLCDLVDANDEVECPSCGYMSDFHDFEEDDMFRDDYFVCPECGTYFDDEEEVSAETPDPEQDSEIIEYNKPKPWSAFELADEDASDGTHLIAYMDFSVDPEKYFGPANSEGDQYKVTTEWILRFVDGTILTIYDWKGERWHIGGHQIGYEEYVGRYMFGDDWKNYIEKA